MAEQRATGPSSLILQRLIILLAVFCCGRTLAASQPVRLGAFDNYPCLFMDYKGDYTGFFVELMDEIASEEDWDLEYLHGSWSQQLQRLQDGEVDLIVGLARTEEYANGLNFCQEPLMTVWSEVYTRQTAAIKSIFDLKGKRIALMKDDHNAAIFRLHMEGFGIECEYSYFPNFSAVIETVKSARADAAIVVSTYSATAIEQGLKHTDIVFEPFGIYCATNKNAPPEIIEAIDRHLAAWKTDNDSIYYASLKQWLNREASPRNETNPILWRFLILTVLILIVVTLFMLLLQKRVNRAVAQLKDSEEWYGALFNSATDGIVLLKSFQFVDCNPRAIEMFGAPLEELRMKTPLDYSPEMQPDGMSSRDKYELNLDKLLNGNLAFFEWRHQRPDGVSFDVEVNITPLNLGGEDYLLAIVRDITGRKQMERQLESELLRRKTLFEQVPDGIVVGNPQTGEIIEFNEAAHKLLGYTREEYAQLTVPDIEASEMKEEVHEHFRKIETHGESSYETLHRTKDGETRTVLIVSKSINLEGQEIFQAVWRDITDQKRAEQALRESEARMRAITESAQDGIIMTDPKGSIEFWNPAAERIFGHTADEVIGKNLHMLIAPERYHPQYHRAFEHFRIAGEGAAVGKTLELNAQRKDGEEIPVELSLSAIEQPDGWHAAGIVRDISERRRAEKEQDHLREQLIQAQKMESVGRLAGGVAHDFNNMLSVIVGHADIAFGKIDDSSPLRNNLSEIRDAAKRSTELTRQLLAFARKQTAEPKVLDLNATIESMLKILRRLIGEDMALTWQPDASIMPVYIDPAQIDQVLANLCVNARDAIGQSQGKVTIKTGMAAHTEQACRRNPDAIPGHYVMLAVTDNGCGMTEKIRANIFEPFFTTKGVGKGTGLGLSTIYGIAKQNGGFIDVESAPGAGSTFKVYFPLHQSQADVVEEEPQAAQPPHGDETILVAEDETAILSMTRTILEHLGYAVLAAPTPSEALEMADSHNGRIDLLITDVIMPEMNGRELSENIRAKYPAIRRLFMSGYTADIISNQGVLIEGVNFIQKPFTNWDLAVKVREALDR